MSEEEKVDQKILKKIHDLLKLASSANENESTIAWSKAQELLSRYNISMAEAAAQFKPENSIKQGTPLEVTTNIIGWKLRLASALSKLNGCWIYTDKHLGKTEIRIHGYESNIQIVWYFYASIVSQVQYLAGVAKQEKKGSGKSWYNNYKQGIVLRVIERLKIAHEKVREEYKGTTALVLADGQSALVKDFVTKSQGLKLHTIAIGGPNHRAGGFREGLSDGNKVNIAPGVSTSHSEPKRLA